MYYLYVLIQCDCNILVAVTFYCGEEISDRFAQAWINKKLKQGVTRNELRACVGSFSNKSKKKVMQEKNLTEKQYKKRYDFLAKVYSLL